MGHSYKGEAMGKRFTAIVASVVVLLCVGLVAGYTGTRLGYRLGENRICLDLRGRDERNLRLAFEQMLGIRDFRSQTCQDKWVSLVVYPEVTEGFFVDVGSASGERLSNTKLLETRGWEGICIDPFPRDMEDRSCSLFKEVVFGRPGEKVRFRAAGDIGGIDAFIDRWRDNTAKAKVVEFTTVTLDDILERAGAPEFINYMSLDIEGAELEALKGLSFDRYQFGALTIEHNFEEPKRSQIRALLESNGYVLVRSVLQDDWYLNKAIVDERGGIVKSAFYP